ncbi:MAG: methyltransferase domain-containing protein [Acidimicrobiaceae bacterium]|nr:methyltransferase domain-containing protein [Acidimicrobiaceae bacterium]
MGHTDREVRRRAFAQDNDLSAVDRFGTWLSARRIRNTVGGLAGKRVADVGCGYRALFARTLLEVADSLLLLDVSLDPGLAAHPRVTAIEGVLPDAMAAVPDQSLDVVVCNSVLEHLWEPEATLGELFRVLAPGGALFLNVPSWRGKWFLEFSAFRLGTSPADEMDDHKTYFDPRDLWPSLVRAGFRPRDIQCRHHKFGLNTFAACRKVPSGPPSGQGDA